MIKLNNVRNGRIRDTIRFDETTMRLLELIMFWYDSFHLRRDLVKSLWDVLSRIFSGRIRVRYDTTQEQKEETKKRIKKNDSQIRQFPNRPGQVTLHGVCSLKHLM